MKKYQTETAMHKKVADLFNQGANLLEATLDKIHE